MYIYIFHDRFTHCSHISLSTILRYTVIDNLRKYVIIKQIYKLFAFFSVICTIIHKHKLILQNYKIFIYFKTWDFY